MGAVQQHTQQPFAESLRPVHPDPVRPTPTVRHRCLRPFVPWHGEPIGVASSTRCSPGGPVPRPRPTAAGAVRCRERRRHRRRSRHTDHVSGCGVRRDAHPRPSRTHQQTTAISVGRRTRPPQARTADRSHEPITPWAACRPQMPFRTGEIGATGDRGRPGRSAGRVGLPVLIQGADGGHHRLVGSGVGRPLPECRSWAPSAPRRRGRATPDIGGTITPCYGPAASAVLQRPRRIHTGVALPGRSHMRVCRPAFMLCLVHVSGIRCFAVLAAH